MTRGLNRFQIGVHIQRGVDDADGIQQPPPPQQRPDVATHGP
jgi:hypothetical protein